MADTPTLVLLGNPSVHESITENGKVIGHQPRPDLGARVTEWHVPKHVVDALLAGAKDMEAALEHRDRTSLLVHLLTTDEAQDWEIAYKHAITVVNHHAARGIDWVASSNPKLQKALATFLGAAEHQATTELHHLAERDPRLEDLLQLVGIEQERWPEVEAGIEGPTALKTTAGVDLIAGNAFGTSATVAQLNFIALTANSEAPKASNTSLAGEITTVGGGLIRAQASYSHTNGTSEAKLTITFTANGTDSLPVTANKFGVFNKATSGGTMGIETAITATTFNASSDNATLTETLTIT
jgi:hypothetical protein